MINEIVLGIFLFTAAICDIKTKKLPLILLTIWISAGALLYLLLRPASMTDEFMGVLIGIVFIAVAVVSDGKLGMGDGAAILAVGIYLGGRSAGFTCLYALILSAAFSVAVLMTGKYTRNKEIPFIPFLLAGFLLHGAVTYI